MAVIKKDGSYMPLPINIKRGNPIPLDSTSIWYDYDALVEYASTSVVAYVGQIVTYVNQTDNTSTVYVISDTSGTLLEVGSGAGGDAVNVDKNTIVLDEQGLLTLRDFGSKYYRYVAAHTNDVGAEIPASYVLQNVDEQHPWKAGLIPQVTLAEDGTTFILGWYEPNPTTVDGLQTAITALQTEVAGVKSNLTNNYYTKEELKAELAGAIHYRGSIASESDLPTENVVSGDVYIVKDTGKEYIYDGTSWEELGSQTDLVNFETRIGDLETTVGDMSTTVGNLSTSVSDLETRTGTLETTVTKINGDVQSLRSDVTNLISTVGAPANNSAETPTVATGIFASLEQLQNKVDGLDYISGVRVNGSDVPESEGKALLYDFTQSDGLPGLVPAPSASIIEDTSSMYVLTAKGEWKKPLDERIGDLIYNDVTYTTVSSYIDARYSDMTMTWSAITDN